MDHFDHRCRLHTDYLPISLSHLSLPLSSKSSFFEFRLFSVIFFFFLFIYILFLSSFFFISYWSLSLIAVFVRYKAGRIESSARTKSTWTRHAGFFLFFSFFFLFHIPPKHPAFNRGFSTPPGYQKAYMKRQYLLDLTERLLLLLLLLSPRFSARLFAKAAREIPSRYSEPSWWIFRGEGYFTLCPVKKNIYARRGMAR